MTSWQTKKLGDIAIIKRGGSPRPIHDFIVAQNEEGYNWLKIGDVSHTSRYIYKTTSKIKPEGLSKTTLVKKGDFILSNSMSFGRPYIMMVDACIHDGWLTLQDIDKSMDKYFLYYLLMSDYMQNKFKNISAGSGVQNLKRETVMFVDFKSPPKPEQQRIVAILEKWDEGIEALERKIELKEQLKKGLMQQLLTGKLRLPGFTDEWREVRIGDLGQVITGSTPSMNDPSNYGNGYCWATAEDFKGKYIKHTNVMLSDKGRESARMLPIGAILVTCIASIGKNAIASVGLATNQQINSIIVNGSFDNEFIYYYIEQNVNLLKRFAGSSALPILNKGDFESIKITIPVSRDEQSSIAIILSQLDDEISALNKKLTQLKLQKKFLLQNLITGKIRTPDNMEVAK